MAYGLKYQLFFSDIELRKVKVEILEKDYVGLPDTVPVYDLVGDGSPVKIEWEADDDIYHPIIGSRCKLSFYVTDQNTYEDFYKADERQFKVIVKYYQPAGSDWEDEISKYDGADVIWDAVIGAEIYYQPIWEGFLVVDRYQEAVLTNPYPIKLEAIDGLGTLDGFDMPFDASDTSVYQNLFYSLKEILLLTGHEFDIYIANSIRKVSGSTNDTIFHDIEINKYALFNDNLTLKSAKEVLEIILKMTNSRIFQSYARWYVVNNSSLIDNRVDINQEIINVGAGSGDDLNDEPDAPVETPPITAPNIVLLFNGFPNDNVQIQEGTASQLSVQNSGTPAVGYTFTLPDSSTVSQTSNVLSLGNITSAQNGATYSVTATDADGDTDTDTITIQVISRTSGSDSDVGVTDPNDNNDTVSTPVNFALTFNLSGSVSNATTNWGGSETINYAASEVGNAFSITLRIFSLTGEFTAASQVTTATVTGGYSLTKTLQGDIIEVTISGTLPSGGGNETVSIAGAADSQQFQTSFTHVSTVTNSSYQADPPTLLRRGGQGKPYSMSIAYTANSGYIWTGAGNVQVRVSSNVNQSISVGYTSSVLTVYITGTQSYQDQSATLTITGAAVYDGGATSITTNPSGRFDVSSAGGYFNVAITSDGGFTVVSNASWLLPSISSGSPTTTSMQVTVLRSGRKNRTGTITFFPAGSSTALTTITVDQEADQEAQ